MAAVTWPYAPSTLVETLSFLTSVLKAPDGESRYSMRDAVQQLEFQYLVEEIDVAKLTELFHSNPLGNWYVPVWQDATNVAGTLASGSTAISAETSADYRAGGQAILWDSNDSYELVTVASAAGGTVTVSATTATHTDFTIAPIRECIVADGLSRGVQRNVETAALMFIALNPVDLAASPYPTLSGFDVLTDPLSVMSPLSAGMRQAFQMLDSGFGAMELIQTESYIRPRWTIAFEDYTVSSRWSRRQWLHNVRGRDGAFWVPTWKDDLALQADIGASDLTIQVADIMPDAAAYTGIAIQIDDGAGNLYHRIVSGATILAGVATLTITALGAAVSAADATVSLMNLVRFDSDDIRITHKRIFDDFKSSFSVPAVGVQA